MAEFEVRTDRLNNISREINNHGNTIRGLTSSVESVRNNCAIESEAKLIIITKLQRIIDEMEREATAARSLGNSLQQVSQVYRTTEQAIVGHKSIKDIIPGEIADIIKDVIKDIIITDKGGWIPPSHLWKDIWYIISGFIEPTIIGIPDALDGVLDAINKLPDDMKKVLPGEVTDVLSIVSDIVDGEADLDTLEKIAGLFIEDSDKVNAVRKIADIRSNDNMNLFMNGHDRLMNSAIEKTLNGDIKGGLKDLGMSTAIGLYSVFYGSFEVTTEIAADAAQSFMQGFADKVDQYIPGDFGDRCADFIESGTDWCVRKLRALY